MTLGKGIAIAGIWIGAGIMTIALSLGGVGEIPMEHRAIVLAAPAIAAGVATFLLVMFD